MPKFMSSHRLPPGQFTREDICQFGKAARRDPDVKPYCSFVNLSKGLAFCVLEAAKREQVAAWFEKMNMPYEGVSEVELEGRGGEFMDV